MPPTGRLPASIWALGFVSQLLDISSELIHCLLPVFMGRMLMVGLLEGAAEATALIGYGLSAITKPLFALASTAWSPSLQPA